MERSGHNWSISKSNSDNGYTIAVVSKGDRRCRELLSKMDAIVETMALFNSD